MWLCHVQSCVRPFVAGCVLNTNCYDLRLLTSHWASWSIPIGTAWIENKPVCCLPQYFVLKRLVILLPILFNRTYWWKAQTTIHKIQFALFWICDPNWHFLTLLPAFQLFLYLLHDDPFISREVVRVHTLIDIYGVGIIPCHKPLLTASFEVYRAVTLTFQ